MFTHVQIFNCLSVRLWDQRAVSAELLHSHPSLKSTLTLTLCMFALTTQYLPHYWADIRNHCQNIKLMMISTLYFIHLLFTFFCFTFQKGKLSSLTFIFHHPHRGICIIYMSALNNIHALELNTTLWYLMPHLNLPLPMDTNLSVEWRAHLISNLSLKPISCHTWIGLAWGAQCFSFAEEQL